MTRLHADPVEVHTRTEPAGPVPDQFRWRGRRYVVLEVLARWTEAGGWWRGAAVTALTAGDAGHRTDPVHRSVGATAAASATGAGGAAGATGATGATGAAGDLDDGERCWWRVEAGSGRASAFSGGTGIYDLCFDGARGAWLLARVLD